MSFDLYIAAVRHYLGVTVEELADTLLVSDRTVRRWESNERPVPESLLGEVAALVEARRDELGMLRDEVERHGAAVVGGSLRRAVAAAAVMLDEAPDAVVTWNG